MDNREFDKRVREIINGHAEVPEAGSWDFIASALDKKRGAGVIYFKRAAITTIAVAASLAALFFLKGPQVSDIHETEVQIVTPEARPQSSKIMAEHKAPSVRSFASEQRDVAGQQVAEQQVVDRQMVVIDDQVVEQQIAQQQVAVEKEVTEKQPVTEPARALTYPDYEHTRRITHRRRAPLLALSTNLSPSSANNSVTLMAMSQIQGAYVVNDVVSTIQKGYVPQEVISNTKFLMPLSAGLQFQLPVSDKWSVGTGVNYSVLFSHYDAISRNATLETQLTLHYIGIPLNIYYSLLNSGDFRLYLSGGAAVEKGLYADYKVLENGNRTRYGESVHGLQWSASAGMGVEMAVNNSLGLYFDPSVAYYFDNNQPLSIRTYQQLQFKFELGFRFRL